MSLYSTPASRVFSLENSESTVHRKPGSTITQIRKPFVDRAVNCGTPDVNRKQKSDAAIKEPVKTCSPHITENLEIRPEDYFSYTDVESHFDDFIPYFKRLEEHNVFNMLKNYIDSNTPPPSPTNMNTKLEPFELNEEDYDSSFNSNVSYDDYILPKNVTLSFEDTYDVEVPEIDFGSL